MNDPNLKSPTCAACAQKRGLIVPGGVHTVYEGRCANCKQEAVPVASAGDWHRPGTGVHPAAWD